jgi:hypothetical protein
LPATCNLALPVVRWPQSTSSICIALVVRASAAQQHLEPAHSDGERSGGIAWPIFGTVLGRISYQSQIVCMTIPSACIYPVEQDKHAIAERAATWMRTFAYGLWYSRDQRAPPRSGSNASMGCSSACPGPSHPRRAQLCNGAWAASYNTRCKAVGGPAQKHAVINCVVGQQHI